MMDTDGVEGQGEEAQPAVEGPTVTKDLADKYLEGIDPQIYGIVKERVATALKDSDQHANRKIQQLAEELKPYRQIGDPDTLEFLRALYMGILEDPIGTIGWIADQYQEEQGYDLRSDLMAAFGYQNDEPDLTESEDEVDESTPMTRAQIDEYIAKRLEEHQAVQEEQLEVEQAQQEAVQLTQSWIDAQAEKHDLQLNGAKQRYIVELARDFLDEGGAEDGEAAISMAFDAFVKEFRPQPPKFSFGDVPPVATGGSGVLPKGVDIGTPNGRKEAALKLLDALKSQG